MNIFNNTDQFVDMCYVKEKFDDLSPNRNHFDVFIRTHTLKNDENQITNGISRTRDFWCDTTRIDCDDFLLISLEISSFMVTNIIDIESICGNVFAVPFWIPRKIEHILSLDELLNWFIESMKLIFSCHWNSFEPSLYEFFGRERFFLWNFFLKATYNR